MAKYVICAFCGERGIRTDEHVWAQWMRDRAGARALLEGSTGERIELERAAIEVDGEGRFQELHLPSRRAAALLPHVKVDVCATCNSGWMSSLESDVKALLAGYRVAGFPVRLGREEQRLLATWATKSWMAYALIRGVDDLGNPFAGDEYRAMAAAPGPLERMRVVMFHSDSPFAQVGIGVAGALFGHTGTVTDFVVDRDNAGFAYLAADGILMFGVIAPAESPDVPAMRDFVMAPPGFEVPGVIHLHPFADVAAFPSVTLGDDLVQHLIAWPRVFSEHFGLPVVGLTREEADEVRREFLAGADPQELRRRWEGRDGETGDGVSN